ncbi:translation initiation factor IF-2 subunit gamma [Candidatus Pacearchaeota archaeon]|nr:translation initiation factor IF-2 subunit gamma [Candidatus Pacearchaeota archaeon]|tara:strand:+ start:1404 stop:2615 length:1212 start_codon:yes stop_codon:yes gene_type:complete
MTKQEIDIEKLDTINVGIVGHIDHGKTTLLEKLSGKWTDTHSEEMKRGITIKLGYSDALIKKDGDKYTVDKKSKEKPLRYVTFVDAPGHEMLMATMLSGSSIMDAAILVVSAQEGIKPQTAEHLIALKAKGISKVIIVQNKIDLVSKEQAMKNYDDIKEFAKGTACEGAAIIPVSAQQGVNIHYILEELMGLESRPKNEKDKAVFFIARSFDINKPGSEIKNLHGVVLGGALKKGVLKVGDEIEVKPGYSYKKQNQTQYRTLSTKIVSMQKGPYKVDKATSGGSLAIETELDPSLGKSDSLSGGIAGLKDSLPEITENIKVKYSLFDKVLGDEEHEDIGIPKPNELLMLSVNTSITVGQVKKVDKENVEMGLKIPVVPLEGESIGIARNFNGHWRLIGVGEIV